MQVRGDLVARAVSVICVAAGLVGVLGCALRIPTLTMLGVRDNADLMLALLGFALLLGLRASGRRARVGAGLISLVVLLGAILTLSQHLGGWDLGIDRLLVQRPGRRVSARGGCPHGAFDGARVRARAARVLDG